jgi:hypothetical protein
VSEGNASKHQSKGDASMPNMDLIRELPTTEYLRECFDYNQETGVLTWKLRPQEHFVRTSDRVRVNEMHAGNVAGYLDGGYRRITIGMREYKASRVIWKWMTGEEPPLTLDHKDGDPSNNRWVNLRQATQGEQTQNTRLRKDNLSGRRGVSWHRGKWRAVIGVKGEWRLLGVFNSIEEASSVYEATARELFGEFYRQPRHKQEL